jgi:hypothetical protein
MARILCICILLVSLAACAPAQAPQVVYIVVTPTPGNAPASDASATPETIAASDTATPEAAAAVPTDTPPAAAAATETPAAPLAPSATSGPTCTVLQDLNVRRGPGKIYGDPIAALVSGTVVIPQNYVAAGFPGGSWVQVVNPGTKGVGWVSAGTDYVNCTIDLTSLPQGAVPPTPKPAAPSLSNSQPGGSFDDNWHAKLHLSGTYGVRFEVDYKGAKDGDNITSVTFTVSSPDKSQTLWQHQEKKAPYCIYGGDPGCAAWPKVNGALVWDAGNPASLVKSGDYPMTIIVDGVDPDTKDPVEATWTYDRLTVKMP